MTSMRVNRRLEELSGFHLELLQYFPTERMETSAKWKYISSKNATKVEMNENAELRMIPVPSRRPNPSSISDSKGGLYSISTHSQRSHLDAQRCWTCEDGRCFS
ncbi:uncharacterized protein ACNS7B_007232 [Menidia menidia]